jgi:xanthine dehydrogenase YagT iron-sulfur-binding subunit
MAQNPKTKEQKQGVSRRTFLKSMSLSSVGVAVLTGDGLIGKLNSAGVLQKTRIIGPEEFLAEFQINQKKFITKIEPRSTLADVLRDNLGLTGTKIGCNRGACGACTVILSGKTVSSCMTLAVDAIGLPIETIEGLSDGVKKLHPIQEAFIEHDAYQCGFCTSGMIMSCKNLLDKKKDPDMDEIRTAVSGNLCRCGTYPHVFKAVKSIAGKKQ